MSRITAHTTRSNESSAKNSCDQDSSSRQVCSKIAPSNLARFGNVLMRLEPTEQIDLAVKRPEDDFEREADHVADQVLRMPESDVQRQVDDEDEEKLLQAKRASEKNVPTTAPPIVHDVLRSPGKPLDADTRAYMEPRFGRDFSDVRVHTDKQSAESARVVNARAYTVGRDVVFGKGQYLPAKASGKLLIAHELAHVSQQQSRRSMSAIQRVGNEDESLVEGEDVDSPLTWFVINSPEAYLRDPDRNFEIIMEGGKPTRIEKGRGVYYRDGDDREHDRRIYARVEWGDQEGWKEGWILKTNLTATIVEYASTPSEEGISVGQAVVDPKKRGKKLSYDPERYISAGETRKIAKKSRISYDEKVKTLLRSKKFTSSQIYLLLEGSAFIQNLALQKELEPRTPDRLKYVELDEELRKRLIMFFKFLLHQNLISGRVVGAGKKISGRRAPERAHELATFWMFNPASASLVKREDQLKFVRQLVDIKGEDLTVIDPENEKKKRRWASLEQVNQLDTFAKQLPNLELEQLRVKIELQSVELHVKSVLGRRGLSPYFRSYWGPILEAYEPKKYAKGWKEWEKKYYTEIDYDNFLRVEVDRIGEIIDKVHAGIEDIIKEIQEKHTPGTGDPRDVQDAPALEGYPKGDRRRYPNIRNVSKTLHLTGDAADVSYDFNFPYFDPIIDAIGLIYGLRRSAKGHRTKPEYWHYIAVGRPIDNLNIVDLHPESAAEQHDKAPR